MAALEQQASTSTGPVRNLPCLLHSKCLESASCVVVEVGTSYVFAGSLLLLRFWMMLSES